jgi:hypothetical protein
VPGAHDATAADGDVSSPVCNRRDVCAYVVYALHEVCMHDSDRD